MTIILKGAIVVGDHKMPNPLPWWVEQVIQATKKAQREALRMPCVDDLVDVAEDFLHIAELQRAAQEEYWNDPIFKIEPVNLGNAQEYTADEAELDATGIEDDAIAQLEAYDRFACGLCPPGYRSAEYTVVERKQCKSCLFKPDSCPGPVYAPQGMLGPEGCEYYRYRSLPTKHIIYNEKAYTNGEKGLRGQAMSKFCELINQERTRQDSKWGKQRHEWPTWATILSEESGEVAKASLGIVYGGASIEELEAELIQVAAVAKAIWEHVQEVKGGRAWMIAYLAGPIDNCTYEECTGWRIKLAEELATIGIEVRDPTHRMASKIGNIPLIVEGDKREIDKSDIVIAYTPFPSVGTSMEIMYTYLQGKPIYVVSDPGDGGLRQDELSPWIIYHATRIFRTFDELLDGLKG